MSKPDQLGDKHEMDVPYSKADNEEWMGGRIPVGSWGWLSNRRRGEVYIRLGIRAVGSTKTLRVRVRTWSPGHPFLDSAVPTPR
jgi:hypothetical protein